ncbi:MAG: hypothetical protein KF754_07980 [Planctomycetes bacterium]|nr:hypothetical protein [Planctomycetota bacterium]
MWFTLATVMNAPANTPGKDESSLELFFGIMAVSALVTSLLWLYFKIRKPLPVPEPPPNNDSQA